MKLPAQRFPINSSQEQPLSLLSSYEPPLPLVSSLRHQVSFLVPNTGQLKENKDGP